MWWLWEFTRDERCGDRVAKVCLDSDCSCVACENRKGISRSAKPYRRSAPSWLKATAPNVVDQITKMAKKGHTPSQIGVILRDSHGIAQVKAVTGSKILRIMKSQGESPCLQSDLRHHFPPTDAATGCTWRWWRSAFSWCMGGSQHVWRPW